MRALLLAVSFVVAVFSTASAGKSKVAITKIDGDSNAEVQGALKEALAEDFSVISFKETNKALAKLELDGDPTDKDFAKLAEALDAEVIVSGKLDGKGDTKTLKVKLYVTGKKSKKFSVQFGNAKSDKFKRTMQTTLTDKIGALNRTGEDIEEEPKKVTKKKGGDDDDGDEPKQLKKKKGGDDDDDAPKTKKKKGGDDEDEEADEDEDSPLPKSKKKRKASDDEDEDEDEDEESMEGESPLKGGKRAANTAAIRVDFGMSAASRVLDFNSRMYPQQPSDYKNAIVPGARVSAELFPAAFSDPKGRAAGFGVWGDFDRTISLTLQTRDAEGAVVRGKALQQRYSIGAGYRLAFTKSDTSPTVTFGVNYARRTFSADPTTLQGIMLDLPNTDYKMFQPLLGLRIPFGKSVALVAQGRGMLITDAGGITKGDQYGQAKVFGVEAMGGLDFIFSNRFALRLQGEFSQVGFTFTKGAGAKANGRDGDPTTKDVFGAADRSIGGTATLGVLY